MSGTTVGRWAVPAATGAFELFETSSNLDATAHHRAWLGGEPIWVQELKS